MKQKKWINYEFEWLQPAIGDEKSTSGYDDNVQV